MNLQRHGAVGRGILMAGLILGSSADLLAQGTSPWLQAIDVLEQAFTGPIARGLSLIAIVIGGLMFAFGEGGIEEGPGRNRLRAWHGHGRGQLPGVVVLMGGEMTGQRIQVEEDLTLAEAQKVHEIQLATQEQIGGAIKRVRELVADCQRLQTEIERLIELRRWSAPPGISGLVANRRRAPGWNRGWNRGGNRGANLLMEQAKIWRGYPALSRPLTIMGVERRWFLLSATLGLAMWNAINSIVTGGLIFGVLYGAGFWAWKQDPNMLEILRASAKFRARYDPGKWAAAPWTLLIRR